MKNIYLLITVIFTAYFQLMLKWRMSLIPQLPVSWDEKLLLVAKTLFDPLVISAFVAAGLASVCWMATLTKLELSVAYPVFLSLSIFLITTLSFFILKEPLTFAKCLGVLLIFGGLWLVNFKS